MHCETYNCALHLPSALVQVGYTDTGLAVARCRIVAQGAVECLLFVAGIVVELVVEEGADTGVL